MAIVFIIFSSKLNSNFYLSYIIYTYIFDRSKRAEQSQVTLKNTYAKY